ncbi:MAG: ribosome rescue GTPase HflX [Lysobacterales bacterium]
MFERSRRGERAVLVQVRRSGEAGAPSAALEFRDLAMSAGADVLAELDAPLAEARARFFVGKGKAEELRDLVQATGADLVLVNAPLSPVQERNLEGLVKCRVVDRTGLILDIFAARARSHEGKLQVELAQLRHMATRLVRGWTHLERQRGGSIGLRGPGETQLETDRRLLAERVKQLSKRLDKVIRQREQGRRQRQQSDLPQVALVGYTNAGKSTLFNRLTDAQVYAADQLFATLDPTVRRVGGFGFGEIVLADTVGFVRDLPHELVAAFRSTLTEAREADLLLHVIDGADPEAAQRVADVDRVLAEIGAGELPQVLVLNKADLLADPLDRLLPGDPRPKVGVSALTGQGIDDLRERLEAELAEERVQTDLLVPFAAAALRARLLSHGAIRQESEAGAEGWQLQIDLPLRLARQLAHLPGVSGALVRQHLLASTRTDEWLHGED